MRKPILCLDFDGVLHAYTTPWTQADEVSDGPVAGAQEFVEAAAEHFEIVIHSARARTPEGRLAIAAWLDAHGFTTVMKICAEKPPAHVTLDDRAITFMGVWPTIEALSAFKPWNKQEV